VRSGTIALIQYVTAILMILLVSWHLAVRIPWLQGVETFVETMSSDIIYEEISRFWPLLLLLAVVVVIHGVNGVRGILLEWIPDSRLRTLINMLTVIVILLLLAIALHTLIGVNPPM